MLRAALPRFVSELTREVYTASRPSLPRQTSYIFAPNFLAQLPPGIMPSRSPDCREHLPAGPGTPEVVEGQGQAVRALGSQESSASCVSVRR